jgi:hypothetical protein
MIDCSVPANHIWLQDIQNLMKEWSDDLDECERVWLRASWSNRKMFMIDNGGLFEKGM